MNKNIPTKIITHHALSSTSHTAQDIDNWHYGRWPGFTSKVYKNIRGYYYHVGYHYVIEWNGNIVKCRAENEEGAHTIGLNTSSIGICFIGNFDNHMPSPAQLKSFKLLYADIITRHSIPPKNIHPHRRYANKSCHGNLLSDDYFARLVATDVDELKQQIVSLQAILLKLRSQLSKKRMSVHEVR